MAFDRNKYRAAPLSTVNDTVAQTKPYDTYYGGNKGDYAPFWKNRDGITIKRVLPAHVAGDSPYVPMLTTMLKCVADDKDKDGNVIGKKIVNKKIFLATLHGHFPYDIVEEYIKRVYEKAEQIQDKDERSRFLNPITGYRMGGKNGTWVPGIRPQLEYVYYAYIEGKVYRDSLKPKQMEALNKESADLCAQNDTAAIDMFSDPNTGFPLQWDRSKDDNNKTVETIKALPLKMGQTWEDYFEKNAVPDKILEELETYPSLQKLYVDCYGIRDFNLALEGLKRFDEENVYKIFADEEYLDMVEELQKAVEEKSGADASDREDNLPFPDPAAEAAPAPAKKPLMKKKAAPQPAEPTPEEKKQVVIAEFIRQYGDEYDYEPEPDEVEELYPVALKKEDLGYDIPHLDGWDAPAVEAKSKPKPAARPKPQPEPEPEEADGVSAESSDSAMSAIERIRKMREARQKKS